MYVWPNYIDIIIGLYLRLKTSRVGEKIWLPVECRCHGRRTDVSTGAKYPQAKLA